MKNNEVTDYSVTDRKEEDSLFLVSKITDEETGGAVQWKFVVSPYIF